MLGVAQGFTSFLNGTIIAFVIYSASKKLHHVGSPCLSLSPANVLEGCHQPRHAQPNVLL
jgi:hypothetical protein